MSDSFVFLPERSLINNSGFVFEREAALASGVFKVSKSI